MSCSCKGGAAAFEIYEDEWHRRQSILGDTERVYNIGEVLARAICIGQRSDIDAVSVRIGGSPFYPLSVGSPLILRPTPGPLELWSRPYNLDAASGKPGALSVEVYDYVPSWIHERRRGPRGELWATNTAARVADGKLVNVIDSTTEETWFYVPTYGRRRTYLWFAGNTTTDILNDDLEVRIDAVSVFGKDPLQESVVDQHYSPVWPDANDATAFETVSGSFSAPAAKAVVDVEGWELLRVRAKKATDVNGENYAMRWLAVD